MTRNMTCSRICLTKIAGDGDADGGGRIFPEHPSPILHAPRDNISRKDNPSLRYIRMNREYIGSMNRIYLENRFSGFPG